MRVVYEPLFVIRIVVLGSYIGIVMRKIWLYVRV